MTFVLGLDAGGSKTLAAVASADGAILRHWSGPSLDPQHVPDWKDWLAKSVSELCAGERPAAAVLGLPMHGEIEALSAEQIDAASQLFSGPHLVLNDVEIAFDGALTDKAGVLLLAGTGSMAWAKVDGQSLRVGGWGDAFGDEGSAYWIGREALSLAGQALDGRLDAPEFAESILSACGTTEVGLVAWIYGQDNPRSAVASLARTVDRLAGAGEGTAVALLQRAAAVLAAHVEAVRRKHPGLTLPWSFAGSVMQSTTISDHLRHMLGAPVEPLLPPVGGALWRAARLAGWAGDGAFATSLSACIHNQNQRRTA